MTAAAPDPFSVYPGDMVLLWPWGRWTTNKKDDWGKGHRAWKDSGGWFLVLSRNEGEGEFANSVQLDLYSPSENSWCWVWVSTTGKKSETEIMEHIPAESKGK